MTLGKKKYREGLNVCMNYEFNLLHHAGVVARRVHVTAAHKGDDNGPRGKKAILTRDAGQRVGKRS